MPRHRRQHSSVQGPSCCSEHRPHRTKGLWPRPQMGGCALSCLSCRAVRQSPLPQMASFKTSIFIVRFCPQ
jgi:hypothetical protein